MLVGLPMCRSPSLRLELWAHKLAACAEWVALVQEESSDAQNSECDEATPTETPFGECDGAIPTETPFGECGGTIVTPFGESDGAIPTETPFGGCDGAIPRTVSPNPQPARP